MHSFDALAVTADIRIGVAIDLIGDLDATLGDIFSDTLAHLVAEGATDVVLMTKHVAVTSTEGLSAIDGALGAARANGCRVHVEPGSRRMKAAFAAARVSIASDGPMPARGRHLMIARHAERPELRRSA
jgi:anti-anti-sigma regulatory factor